MKIKAFTKKYDERTVLDMPEISLDGGKVYAMVGANGSGKTTFVKLLADIEKSEEKEKIAPGVRIGFMPQKSYGFRMSVKKNLMLNSAKFDESKALELLKALKMEQYYKHSGSKLSGGETAKLALARLLMNDYDAVVFDEPTAAMDMESTMLAEELIKKYVKEKSCVGIFITHSLQEAIRTADEIIFIHEGHLIECGPVLDVINNPQDELTKAFIEFYGK